MPVTMKDIAKELNLSVNTISRGLRDMPDISAPTKKLIHETAARIGYQKNYVASNLRTKRSYLLGVIVTDYRNPAMSDIINGVEAVGKANGFTIMTGASNEDEKDEANTLNAMLSHGVDGIILIPSLRNNRIIQILDNSHVPYMLAIRKFNQSVNNYVACDDVSTSREIAERLYKYGHRNFLYVSGFSHVSSSKQRYHGLVGRLSELGIEADNIHVIECDGSRHDAYKTAYQWFSTQKSSHHPPVTAIFAFSDYVASGVYKAVRECGYRIPDDISIVGFDNSEISEILDPTLCTADNHFYEIGSVAASKLIGMIQSEEYSTEGIIITPDVVWRDSVREISSEAL